MCEWSLLVSKQQYIRTSQLLQHERSPLVDAHEIIGVTDAISIVVKNDISFVVLLNEFSQQPRFPKEMSNSSPCFSPWHGRMEIGMANDLSRLIFERLGPS